MALLEFDDNHNHARIKVIGVGGGGGNAINTMITCRLEGVDFVAANTDLQALESNQAQIKIPLGNRLTKGLGAGANPEIGRNAAMEDRDRIAEVLQGADMVFVTAGMGGSGGSGSLRLVIASTTPPGRASLRPSGSQRGSGSAARDTTMPNCSCSLVASSA